MSTAPRRLTALCLLAALTQRQVDADTIPPVGATDARIRTVVYQRDDVIRLTGQTGYQIDLEFAPNEHFVGLAAGDMEGITFETDANHLFLKPKAPRISTNLTILTDRRSYHLDYRSTPRRLDPSDITAIYAVRFRYPEDEIHELVAAAQLRQDAQRLATALATPNPARNLDYAYCGPKSLRPNAASDDGLQTHLNFAAMSELPAIFVRTAEGGESLVNFTVTGDELIVHRIARQFILRRGREVGCIVNRRFDATAGHTRTGTISPDVTRHTATAP